MSSEERRSSPLRHGIWRPPRATCRPRGVVGMALRALGRSVRACAGRVNSPSPSSRSPALPPAACRRPIAIGSVGGEAGEDYRLVDLGLRRRCRRVSAGDLEVSALPCRVRSSQVAGSLPGRGQTAAKPTMRPEIVRRSSTPGIPLSFGGPKRSRSDRSRDRAGSRSGGVHLRILRGGVPVDAGSPVRALAADMRTANCRREA